MRKRPRPPTPARVSSRPLSVPGKEAGQDLRDLLWGVLLDEVPGLRDELELRARDFLPQPGSLRGVEPPILLTPRHEHGDLDRAEPGLDLSGMPLLELEGLPDEGSPAPLAPPRREVDLECFFAKVAVGLPQVGGEERPEQVVRHGLVGFFVLPDVPRGGPRLRQPRGQHHRVQDGDATEANPLKEVGPKHDAPSYVLAGDRWRVEPPPFGQFPEQSRLDRYGDVLSFPFLRFAVSKEVVRVDTVALCERRNYVAPQVRPHGGAVHQDHRRPLTEDLVSHLADRRQLPLAEPPPAGPVLHLPRPPLTRADLCYPLKIIPVTCYL